MATERDVLNAARALRVLDIAWNAAVGAAAEAEANRDRLGHQRMVAQNVLTNLGTELDCPTPGREFI